MKKIFALLLLLSSTSALAHVKWFSDYDFAKAPLALGDLMHPTFYFLFALSLVSLPLMVWLDRAGEKSVAYNRVNGFLDQYADNGPAIMRVELACEDRELYLFTGKFGKN